MATFGGFSGNPDIESFLLSIQADFVDMTKSYSVILRSSRDTQILQVAQRQAYPRIGLRLSGAKNLDNTYLFSDNSDPTNLLLLYENVVNLITSVDSPFSEGIVRVAAALTASILIRSIPLESDIRNISLGDQIEKGALSDLEEIVKLYTQTRAAQALTLSSSGLGIGSGNTIFISLDIDKTTLPASYFNVAPIENAIRIEEVYPTSNVKLLETLTVPNNKIAFCWYYVTHMDRDRFTSSSSSSITLNSGGIVTGVTSQSSSSIGDTQYLEPVEGVFRLLTGYTAQDIIEELSDLLNEAVSTYESNVIVSPNLQPTSLISVSMVKKKLYDTDLSDPTGIYDKKVASFRLLSNLNSLRFDARRLSAIINRELIIIRFFTIDKEQISNEKYGVTSTYIGNWSATANYAVNNIVNYNGVDYLATVANINSIPSSSSSWVRLLADDNEFINYRDRPSTLDYVDGIIYGLTNSYTFLDKRGPHSVIVDVEKGVVKTTTASSSRLGTGANNNLTAPEDEYIPDTFYFQTLNGAVTGDMRVRVSSALSTEVPEWTVSLTNATAEDVALAFLNSLYVRSQPSDTLGVLVFPHAVQIVAFQITNEEVKVVVDITQVPAGLDVATGTAIQIKTAYRNRPRSVAVESRLRRQLASGQTPGGGNSSLDLLNRFTGSVSTHHHKKSKGLQSVYDKLDALEEAKKRYYSV